MSESETWIDPYAVAPRPAFRNPNGYPVGPARRRPAAPAAPPPPAPPTPAEVQAVASGLAIPERIAALLQPGEVPARAVTRLAYFNFRVVRRGKAAYEAVATRARDYNEEVFGTYPTPAQARRALTRAHRTFAALREAC